MIFADFLKALGQIGDSRFRSVLWKGILLTLLLLAGLYAVLVTAIQAFGPETLTLPWIGEIGWIDNLLSWASLFLMLGLSIFLMAPVAAAFTAFFLDDIVDAVEARHYPELSKAEPLTLSQQVIEALNATGILIMANLAALIVVLFAAPLAPFMYWGMNAYLIGREYFLMAASRRLGRKRAMELHAQNSLAVWALGLLVTLPLVVPVLNLAVPVIGVAAFTHLAHRTMAKAAATVSARAAGGPSNRNP